MADGSGCIASARVGSRQSFKQNPEKSSPGFVVLDPTHGIDFSVHMQLSVKLFPFSSALASILLSPDFNWVFFQMNTQFVVFLISDRKSTRLNSSHLGISY